MSSPCPCRGCTAAYKVGYDEGYRAGYNDHARARAYAEQVYGPYTRKESDGSRPELSA